MAPTPDCPVPTENPGRLALGGKVVGNGTYDPSSFSGLEKMMLSHFNRLHRRQDEILKRLRQVDHHVDRPVSKESSSRPPYFQSEASSINLNLVAEQASKVRSKPNKAKFVSNSSTTSAASSGSKPDSVVVPEAGKQLEKSKSQDSIHTVESIVHFQRKKRDTAGSSDNMVRLAAIVARHSTRFQMSPWAKSVWLFFENRNSSRFAHFYGGWLAPSLICISVVLSLFQTADEFALPGSVFSTLQMCIEILFASELLLRFQACPDRYAFVLNIFNWIDFLSACPIPLRMFGLLTGERASSSSVWTAMLGLVPILRLLKILRRFRQIQLLMEAFWLTAEALPVLLFAFGLIAIFFSGLIYSVEPRTLIPSLPKALWFVVVTMTTVGYGDIVPETSIGACLSSLLMVVSALYLAMPLGIVGNAFSKAWDDRDRLLLMATLRETFSISGVSLPLFRDMVKLFAGQDISDLNSDHALDSTDSVDQEPKLTVEQFQNMVLALQINVTEERVAALFKSVHVDGGGSIDMQEFVELLFPTSPLKKHQLAITHKVSQTLRSRLSTTSSMGAFFMSGTSSCDRQQSIDNYSDEYFGNGEEIVVTVNEEASLQF